MHQSTMSLAHSALLLAIANCYSVVFIVLLSGYGSQHAADASEWPATDGSYTQQQTPTA